MSWSEKINLKAGYSFRFQCSENIKLLMTKGSSEIYGTEFSLNHVRSFPKDYSGCLITFTGCTLQYSGSNFKFYIMTFMEDNNCPNILLNIHSALENERNNCLDHSGPRVMICGDKNTGKKFVSQTLVNYRIRNFGKIILIDTNVDYNLLCLPTSLAAMVVTHPYDVIDGWYIYEDQLVYNFGYLNPHSDSELYMMQLKKMSDLVDQKLTNDADLNRSGLILNMSSLQNEQENNSERVGFLLETIQMFQINCVLVIENGMIEHEIKKYANSKVRVIRIPRSSVVEFENKGILKVYSSKVQSYFLGQGLYKLNLKAFKVVSDMVKIYRFQPKEKGELDRLSNPTEIKITHKFLGNFFALSQATEVEDVATTPIYGYVMVSQIAKALATFYVQTPSGAPLPSKIFIFTEFKFDV